MKTLVMFFEVYDDYSVDGRGNTIRVIGRFADEVTAKLYAKGRGNYGQNAQVRKEKFVICDSITEMESVHTEERVEKALRKLTLEERLLLGLP